MTTRHSGYLVVLAEDLREDDAKPLLDAIRLLRGVASVQPIESECGTQAISDARVRSELTRKLHEVLNPLRGGQ